MSDSALQSIQIDDVSLDDRSRPRIDTDLSSQPMDDEDAQSVDMTASTHAFDAPQATAVANDADKHISHNDNTGSTYVVNDGGEDEAMLPEPHTDRRAQEKVRVRPGSALQNHAGTDRTCWVTSFSF